MVPAATSAQVGYASCFVARSPVIGSSTFQCTQKQLLLRRNIYMHNDEQPKSCSTKVSIHECFFATSHQSRSATAPRSPKAARPSEVAERRRLTGATRVRRFNTASYCHDRRDMQQRGRMLKNGRSIFSGLFRVGEQLTRCAWGCEVKPEVLPCMHALRGILVAPEADRGCLWAASDEKRV